MYSGAANEINNIDSVLTTQSLAALNGCQYRPKRCTTPLILLQTPNAHQKTHIMELK